LKVDVRRLAFASSSAQLTFENSPAIYRWELDHGRLFEYAKRTKETAGFEIQISVARSAGFDQIVNTDRSTKVLGYYR